MPSNCLYKCLKEDYTTNSHIKTNRRDEILTVAELKSERLPPIPGGIELCPIEQHAHVVNCDFATNPHHKTSNLRWKRGLKPTCDLVAEDGGLPTAAAPEELLPEASDAERSLLPHAERRRRLDHLARLLVVGPSVAGAVVVVGGGGARRGGGGEEEPRRARHAGTRRSGRGSAPIGF